MTSRTRRLLALSAPGLTLAALVLVDAFLGSRVVISGSFAISAVVAAVFLSVRTTAAFGALAVVLAAGSGWWNDNLGTRPWAIRLVLAILLSALAVASAKVRVRREQSLTRMTTIAETAQRALLRPLPTPVRGLQLAARYVSAAEEALVGGDLYEAADTAYGLRLIVGDVRGKGIDAVQLAATVLSTFRQVAFTAPSLGCVAIEMDDLVSRVAGEEDFVTALMTEFHDDGSVVLVNCGHPRPLLLAGGSAREVDTGPPQLPLGLGAAGHATTMMFPSEARLLMYTDGLVETRSPFGDFFPLAEHAQAVAGAPFETALDQLLQRLRRHARDRVTDDVAVLLVGASP